LLAVSYRLITSRKRPYEGWTTMTSTRHTAGPLRPRRRSTADKIISAGLATAACAGLVGVIGVRTMEQSAAAQGTSTDAATAVTSEPTTSTGLTQADLDAYAAQLAAQSAELDAYRAKLVKSANKLNAALAAASTGTSTAAPAAKKPTAPTTVTAPKPVAKPAPKPVAKPAPASKPASNTKSS